MTDVKRNFDDDDEVDMKVMEPDSKIDGSSGSEAEDDNPDETMDFPPSGIPDVWLVKVPKSLMERWTKVEKGTTLANMRVYNSTPGENEHRVAIQLPEEAKYDTAGESASFSLNVSVMGPSNQFAFMDAPKPPVDPTAGPSKARSSQLVGRVAHEGQLVPQLDTIYQEKVRNRSRAANTPKRTMQILSTEADKVPNGKRTGGIALRNAQTLRSGNGQANLKMLASGAGRDKAGIALSQKKPKKDADRFIRIERNLLIDKLMELFQQKDAWSMKEIREATEQPTEYLKEILNMVAEQPKSGPNTNMWLLTASQKAIMALEAQGPSASGSSSAAASQDVKMEDVKPVINNDEMDVVESSEEEEDFEEV